MLEFTELLVYPASELLSLLGFSLCVFAAPWALFLLLR